MSGTDHGQEPGWAGPAPVIVLVRPQMGENIGAAARAMWNFGLDRLRLVSPRDGWPNERAVAMASGAGRVLDGVRVTGTSAEACADLNFVFATTARRRDLTKTVLSPEQAMAQAHRMIAEGQQVGVMFGPERAGLENDDVARANALISVPVNPAFASLNLAQCVLLLAYEWCRSGNPAAPQPVAGKARPAEAIEVDNLVEHLRARLDTVNFFWPEDKRPSMIENLRNLFSRMPLTDLDVRILHGVIRALSEKTPVRK